MGFPNVKILLFMLLAVVTIVCHTFVERFEKIGPEMLTGNWSFHAQKTGRAGKKETGLFLLSSDQKTSVNIQQDIQSFKQNSILKLSADMKCQDVQQGKKPWDLARLLLVQHDGQKDRWNLPHLVASFAGNQDWKSYSKFFIIVPETKKLRVVAQLSQCTGSFHLKNIHLFPVIQTQIYTWVKRSILTLWGIFGIFLLGSCFLLGKKQILLQAILVLAFIAIIIGTTMPSGMKTQVSNQISTQIQAADETFDQILPWDITKTGHFCFFALFGLVLSLLMSREPVLLVMAHILLLAGGTEIAQFFIDGRSPLFLDFVIDVGGGLTGILLIELSGMKKSKITNSGLKP